MLRRIIKKIKLIIKDCLPYFLVKNRVNTYTVHPFMRYEPNLYNEYGEKMKVFYIKDSVSAHTPYSIGSININSSRYIFWDRSNIALPVHFYGHYDAIDKKYVCKKKFAILGESESIIPDVFNEFVSKKLYKEFDAVFTHSKKLLDLSSNCHFLYAACMGYGGWQGGLLDEKRYEKKTKLCSIISSDKHSCKGHLYRIHIANLLTQAKICDGFGKFNGGEYFKYKSDTLDDYMFQVVIENDVKPLYFTEKILDCFGAMTVPIYYGAQDIGKYFNREGIIEISHQMSDLEILDIVKNLTKEKYDNMRNAIIDNYNRVLNYKCMDDYLYEKYKDLFNV